MDEHRAGRSEDVSSITFLTDCLLAPIDTKAAG